MGKEHLYNTKNFPITLAVADFVLVPYNVLEDNNEEAIGELIDKNFDGVK
jgi:hypothetical protein